MNNYFVRKVDNKFIVKEQKTDFVIKTFNNHDLASKFARKLNAGGAFNGETPPFFVNKKEQVILND